MFFFIIFQFIFGSINCLKWSVVVKTRLSLNTNYSLHIFYIYWLVMNNSFKFFVFNLGTTSQYLQIRSLYLSSMSILFLLYFTSKHILLASCKIFTPWLLNLWICLEGIPRVFLSKKSKFVEQDLFLIYSCGAYRELESSIKLKICRLNLYCFRCL
jgi:hypothetical protein